MNVFIQGMRRSATTFLFDFLCADGAFDAWYEPLAAARKTAVGGGSRIRGEDFFQKIRDARGEFGRRRGLDDLDALNCGAPADAMRELKPDFPLVVRDYVAFLTSRKRDSLLKFVRCYNKMPALHAIDPGARVIHIVRDPRAVATSFLMGKGRKHAATFEAPDAFFGHDATGPGPKRLQALAVADAAIELGLVDCPPDAPTYVKLLALWAMHFRLTHEGARRSFGAGAYLLLRHEDMLEAPEDALDRVYALLGRPVPDAARAWLGEKLDPTRRVVAPDDDRWAEAFAALGIEEDLARAGYHESAPSMREGESR